MEMVSNKTIYNVFTYQYNYLSGVYVRCVEVDINQNIAFKWDFFEIDTIHVI